MQAHLRTAPDRGILSLKTDGSFTYRPVPGETYQTVFRYKCWENGQLTEADVTIDVTAGNQAPVAVDDTYYVTPGTRLYIEAPGVISNDVDPEGGPLVSYLTSQPELGHLGFHQDGSLWFDDKGEIPPCGQTTFQYKVVDDHGYLSHATVTLVLEDFSVAPEITSTPITQVALLDPYRYQVTLAGEATDFQLLAGPAGMALSANGLLTWVPDEGQEGAHPVSLSASGTCGDAAEQHFTIDVGEPAQNRPPVITSTPPLTHLLVPSAGEGEIIPLGNWTPHYYPTGSQRQAHWRLEDEETTVVQIYNAKPSAFVSDFIIRDARIYGTWRVETTHDDDYIGFLFGYQDPTHHYMFTWKQGNQGQANRGMSLRKYDRDEGNIGHWSTNMSEADGELLFNNTIPWRDHTSYDFELEFHPGEISITVREGESVLEAFTVFDDSYSEGRFAFYNYSQDSVRYTGFRNEALSSRDYVYLGEGYDPDGDVIRWQLIDAPEGTTLDAETGELIWSTTTRNVGTHDFTIRLVDEHGLYDEQSWQIVVEDDAPVITSEAPERVMVGTDLTYDVAVSDPTPDDTRTFSLLEAPTGMTVDVATGLISFIPDETMVGMHPVSVQVADTEGNTAVQSWDLEVYPAGNLPPVLLTHLPSFIPRNTPFRFRVLAEDPEGAPLTFSTPVAERDIAINSQTGLLSLSQTFPGEVRVRVDIHDPEGAFTTESVTITVVDNQAPVISADPPLETLAGRPYTANFSADDPDGDALTWELLLGPTGMTMTPDGILSWTPGADVSGPVQIVVGVRDIYQQITFPYTLNVLPFTNGAPQVVGTPPGTWRLEVPFAYQLEATDPEGDTFSYALTTGPSGMAVDAEGNITWQPVAGSHPITVTLTDAYGGENPVSWTLQVEANRAPTFDSQPPLEVAPLATYTYTPVVSDFENDGVIFALTTAPTGMTLTDGTVTFTPTGAQSGTHPVVLTATDDFGAVTTQSWDLVVSDNRAPVFASTPELSVEALSAWSYTPAVSDPDGHTFVIDFAEGPTDMTYVGGVLSFSPSQDQVGAHQVRLVARDELGGETTQAFTLNVLEFSNGTPTITSTPDARGRRGELWSYQATASDPENHPLTWSLEGPAGATVNSTNGLVRYTPAEAGTHSMMLTVTDFYGAAIQQPIDLVVQYQDNSAPTFTNQPVLTAQAGIAYAFDADVFDEDGYPLFFSLTTAPAGMDLDPTRGIVHWTPTLSQLGSHSVVLTVADAHEATAQLSWQIQVTDPGDIEIPQVFMNLDKVRIAPGEVVNLQASFTDNVGVVSVEVTLNGTPIALDGNSAAQFTGATPGVYRATASVADAAGNVAEHSQDFWVTAPGDEDGPFVAIHSPERDTNLSAPVPVFITVDDPNLAHWTLEVGKTGKDCWTTLATGFENVANETVADLDSTLLPNGMYTLRLTAFDLNDRGTRDEAMYVIEGIFKVGRFTMGFRDLELPLKGIPAQLNRLYDSMDKCPGDFGYGWSLDDADVQASITLGRRLDLDEQFYCVTATGNMKFPPYTSCSGQELPLYCVEEEVPHYVTVNMPGGVTYQYDLHLEPVSADPDGPGNCRQNQPPEVVHPSFEAREGTDAELEVVNMSGIYFRYVLNENDQAEYMALDSSGDPWSPTLFRLTTSDGVVYEIHRDEGLRSITDLEGNSLSYASDGISHSSGERIAFTRDGQGRITTATDPDGGVVTYAYDAAGDLISVTDREGGTVHYTYDDYHNLTEVRDEEGRIPAKYFYDEDGRLIAQEDANGNRINYDHDIDGRQEIVYDSEGRATVYLFDDRGNIVQQTNPLGITTSFTYDDRDRETSKTLAVGTLLESNTYTSYDNSGNVLSETDRLGRVRTLNYDDNDRPLNINGFGGEEIHISYTERGTPASVTAADGGVYQIDYTIDETRNREVVTTTDPLGLQRVIERDYRGYDVRTIDARGHATDITPDFRGRARTTTTTRTDTNGHTHSVVWGYSYDREGRQTRVTDPLGNVMRYEYDSEGREIAFVDALGRRTETVYDGSGRFTRRTYPDGTREVVTYDQHGNLKTSMNRSGATTRYSYDAAGRQTSQTSPDGTSIQFAYDDLNRLVSTTDPAGFITTVSYASDRDARTITDPLGNVTTYEYNAHGAVLSITDGRGNTTTNEYDSKNRRTGTVFPDGTRTFITYDALDRRLTETDTEGRITRFFYDNEGNLERVENARGDATTYAFDEVGNQVSQTDALGRVTRFGYDDAGRRISRTLPLGMVETRTYDALGNLQSKTDFNGGLTTYTYDDSNRLIQKTRADGEEINYTWLPGGDRESVSDSRGTTHYTYDLLQRPLRITYPDDTWVGYQYDARGLRSRVSTANQSVDYGYDGVGRLETVTSAEGEARYTYDAVGNRASVTHANGTATAYTYDALNRLTELQLRKSDGSLINSYNYSLNNLGQRLSVSEANGRTVNYTYDVLRRLTREEIIDPQYGNRTAEYSYDAVGNRLNRDVNGVQTAYTYDDNDRLLSDGTSTYTYDHNGNMLSRETGGLSFSYTYNSDNELLSAETPDGNVSYTYDAGGIRLSKTMNGVLTRYLVDPNRPYAQVLEELDDMGVPLVSYVYGDDLLSQQRQGDSRFYLYNGHGSTVALSDAIETITDTYLYEGFGEVIAQTGSTLNDYLYTGEQYDPNLGFYYLRDRYFQPETGRFIGMDAYEGQADDPPSLHKYVYTTNDPANQWDPSGNFGLMDIAAANTIRNILMEAQLSVLSGFEVVHDADGDPDEAMKLLGWAILVDMGVAGAGSLAPKLLRRAARFFRRGCFVAGTLVTTLQGPVAIEQINPGDLVLTDPTEFQVETLADPELVITLDLSNGQGITRIKLALDDNDPFLTVDGELVYARDLQPGDSVIYNDEHTALVEGLRELTTQRQPHGNYQRVLGTSQRYVDQLLVLKIAGEVIHTTPEHQFKTYAQTWVLGKDLRIGDLLLNAQGEPVEVLGLQLLDQPTLVYNMEIEGSPTYHVGSALLVVHNGWKCGIDWENLKPLTDQWSDKAKLPPGSDKLYRDRIENITMHYEDHKEGFRDLEDYLKSAAEFPRQGAKRTRYDNGGWLLKNDVEVYDGYDTFFEEMFLIIDPGGKIISHGYNLPKN